MSSQRRKLFEGVESVKFITTKVPAELPPLQDVAKGTITRAIHIVLMHAKRPTTVFEIAAELRKHGVDVRLGQYELFSTVYQHLAGPAKDVHGFQKV